MLSCQKELFSIDEGTHYINCAYMSPLLKSAEQAGIEGMRKKRNPARVAPDDFFNDALIAQELFGKLVNTPAAQVALIPSASYGLANVARNCPTLRGGKLITVAEEFPSDVYTLQRLCQENEMNLVTIQPPEGLRQRGRIWNETLLEAITPGTVMVNISSVHWADGTMFDLEAIGKRVKEVNGLFVVDGTQSVGAMEMDVRKFNIDALICAGYKWLLGPYTSGFAYFNESFNNGIPIEESWLNRIGSGDFQGLVNYQSKYKPGAARYNMGEYSNFINLPMQITALNQLLSWSPAAISSYDKDLTAPLLQYLEQNGYWVEEEKFRARHMFGFRLPGHLPIASLKQKFLEKKIVVSLRGSAVRISPHLYNDMEDISMLISSLEEISKEFRQQIPMDSK